MSSDLERLVNAAEGQAPSPEFVARLREWIVAETEGVSTGDRMRELDDTGIVVDLDEPASRREATRSRRPRLIRAAAAVVVLVLIGIWALATDTQDAREDLDTVDVPTTTRAPDPGVATSVAPLTAGNTFVDAGTFRIDTLGTPFTFSVEGTTGVLLNENGVVMVTDLTSAHAADRTLTFHRTAFLPDPAEPTAAIDRRRGGWPATDLDGWLAQLGEEVTAGEPLATTLGGLNATYAELEFACPRLSCSGVDPLADVRLLPMFTAGARHRMWVVDQGDTDPVVVVAAIDDASEVAWFDHAERVLATIEFESTRPNPVRVVPVGPVTLDVFDGLRLDLPDGVVVVEPFPGFARLLPTEIDGDVEFLTRPLDNDGAAVGTTDRLLDILADQAVEVIEIDAIEVGGLAARSFAVDSGTTQNVALKAREDDLVRAEFGWASPRFGHIWAVEHPERGLFLVSAGSWFGPDEVEPLRAWTEEMLASLRFR